MDHENLGEFLAGDRIENSPYELAMQVDTFCQQTCVVSTGRKVTDGKKPTPLARAIKKQYHNNWIVDNLNSAGIAEDSQYVTTRYWQGFPLGFVDNTTNVVYINNHVNIKLMYHKSELETDKFRIVQFLVEPFSIKHDIGADNDEEKYIINNPIHSCDKNPINHTSYSMVKKIPQEVGGRVLFTYDVIWEENTNLKWASRWDVYLSMDHTIKGKVHWLAIANSLVIVFVLSAMIIAILVRNLHRDINRYNKVAVDEETRAEELEEYGWKLVSAVLFRNLVLVAISQKK
jgi:transmembrane 9 superfamily member 2/4